MIQTLVLRDTALILLQGYDTNVGSKGTQLLYYYRAMIQMLVLRDTTLILLQGYDTNVGSKGHNPYIITGL